MESPIKPKWHSPHQLAALWGVNRETVLRLVRSGQLPALRLNRRVYRISEVDAAAFYITRYRHKAQLTTSAPGSAVPTTSAPVKLCA